MRAKFFSFISIYLIGFGTFAQINQYNVGDTVNNFTLTDTDGQTYTLYDILNQGKYVYIDFFATNCGTCQAKIPVFNAFYDKYGCNAGDVFCLSIEVGGHNNADVMTFEQQYGGNTHHAPAVSVDGGASTVVTDFGISTYPVICGIDPAKKLFIENVSPVQDVNDIAQSFPSNFNPPVMQCSGDIERTNADIIKIFPIPVRHTIHISTPNTGWYIVKIFDVNGQQVLTQKFFRTNEFLLNVDLKNGIYLLKISNEKNLRYQQIVVIN